MYQRQRVPAEIIELGNGQGQVVSRRQCLDLGLSRSVIQRHLDQRLWHPLAPGVYCLRGPDPGWRSWVWAGILAGGSQAMAARRAAALLWGMIDRPPATIDVLVPISAAPTARKPWRFVRTRNLPRAVGSPPRTPVAETTADLCSSEPDRAATWLAAALHTRKTHETAIRAVVEGRSKMPHRAAVIAMLAQRREGIESELERLYASIERAHGLPKGRRQRQTGPYRSDVDYDGLIVELDGRLGHDGAGRFRDMRRDNHQLVNGRMTLRYGWEDCTQRPCQVAAQVAAVLRTLGWPAPYRGCPTCRPSGFVKDRAA